MIYLNFVNPSHGVVKVNFFHVHNLFLKGLSNFFFGLFILRHCLNKIRNLGLSRMSLTPCRTEQWDMDNGLGVTQKGSPEILHQNFGPR